jgi:23S rRNA (guanosine2251-2'-O)-methyltransferase
MGSEGEGISGEYLKLTDVKVRIPMLGTIASLNVSVATAVLLYEVVRQREFNAQN